MIYGITIRGCDDSTNFNVDLDYEQYKAVRLICLESTNASRCGCQPVLWIGHAHTPEDDDDE